MANKKYLNLEMKDIYFNRANCIETAKEIIANGQITGMTVKQIATEIYTHAFVFYKFSKLPEIVRNSKIAKRIYSSAANGIDLEDNGDSLKRRVCYSLIWCLN